MRISSGQNVELFCIIEAYPMLYYKNYIKWYRKYDEKDENTNFKQLNAQIATKTNYTMISETEMNMTLPIRDASKKDNGTYYCLIDRSPKSNVHSRAESSVYVLEAPQVSIDFLKAVGANKIFMNWTVMDGNDPVQNYFVQSMKEGTPSFSFYNDQIGGKNTSYILEKFDPSTNYQIKIMAKNSIGTGPPHTYNGWVKTLEKDPVFVPEIEATGNTHSSVTIGWAPPPNDVLEYINFYELVVTEANGNSSVVEEAIHEQNSRNLPYMFDNLKTSTEYLFRVRACSYLTKQCGNWSKEVSGTTSDGTSSEPLNLAINCDHFNITGRNTVSVQWDRPAFPNGVIIKYQADLVGVAEFRNEKGELRKDNSGLKSKHVEPTTEARQRAIFEGVAANTNYTVFVSAITRSKRPGAQASAVCKMASTVPDTIGKLLWGKLRSEKNDWIFKLYLPRLTERNGPICCYRIYLYRLAEQTQTLEAPYHLDVQTFHEVHAPNNTKGGAYIAEVLPNFHLQQEVFLGDGENAKVNKSNADYQRCRICWSGVSNTWRKKLRPTTTTTIVPAIGKFFNFFSSFFVFN